MEEITMNEFNKENIIVFLDLVQRTIIGEELPEESNDVTLVVRNPVVVNIMPQYDRNTNQQTGQMALQLLPLFFKEFLAEKDESVVYRYPKNMITTIEKFKSGFDFRLYQQYQQITWPSRIITPAGMGQITPPSKSDGNSLVVNLFPNE